MYHIFQGCFCIAAPKTSCIHQLHQEACPHLHRISLHALGKVVTAGAWRGGRQVSGTVPCCAMLCVLTVKASRLDEMNSRTTVGSIRSKDRRPGTAQPLNDSILGTGYAGYLGD